VIIAGIDPGKGGALAILFPDGSVEVHRVPLQRIGKKEVPCWTEWAMQWSMALRLAEPDKVMIENVSARPTQGVTSMFNFGKVYGFAIGIAAAARCPIEFVTPSVWKGKVGLLKADKNASREKARQLYPKAASELTRVNDDGVAEAVLMAHCGKSS